MLVRDLQTFLTVEASYVYSYPSEASLHAFIPLLHIKLGITSTEYY